MADELTEGQRLVVALVAEGLTNRQTADQLGLAVDTAKHHVSAAMRYYGATNRVQLVLAWLSDVTPPVWEFVALVARSGDSHWVGEEAGGVRRLCVHTAAGPLGWPVPAGEMGLMPALPLGDTDHSGDAETTYRRLARLPVRQPTA